MKFLCFHPWFLHFNEVAAAACRCRKPTDDVSSGCFRKRPKEIVNFQVMHESHHTPNETTAEKFSHLKSAGSTKMYRNVARNRSALLVYYIGANECSS